MDTDYKYEPKNGLTRWLDSRLPLMRFTSEHVLQFPTPKNLNYFWTFGFILTMCLVTQIITGIILAMHYAPSTLLAFDSVEHIMRNVNYGWLIRYIHSNGASMFFLAVFIHMFRGLYYGSYKEPREVIWILGCIIYLLMIVTAFMGGFAVDNPTLNRFFSLHYLLPFIIFGVVLLHIWALHVPGNNNPVGLSVQGKQDTVAFHPYYTVKDFFAYTVFLLLFCYFIFYNPNALGHADNYIEADAMVTPAHIVPEWYLLPFYAILRAVPDKLAGVLLMFGAIAVLFFLPWLDTAKVRSGRYRPIFRYFYVLFVIDCLILGYLGAQVPEGIYLFLSRVTTIYYFAFFLLVLPILGRIEKMKPMPIGISNSELSRDMVAAE